MRLIKSAAAYFVLVFCTGFILGVARVLWQAGVSLWPVTDMGGRQQLARTRRQIEENPYASPRFTQAGLNHLAIAQRPGRSEKLRVKHMAAPSRLFTPE